MSLDDIPAGVTTFVDSTVLHYAIAKFEAATPQCIRFLDRIAKSELIGCLTLPVLNDAVHKVMCSDAVARFKRPRAGLVNWLKQNPAQVKELTRANELLDLIGLLPIRFLAANLQSMTEAQHVINTHGLLASDALILALMQRHGISHLATNDDDFDQIPGITVWKPRALT